MPFYFLKAISDKTQLLDPEEMVVEKVLRSLASMASIGLFQRSKTWELIEIVSRFTMHPNLWIRQGKLDHFCYKVAVTNKWHTASTSFITNATKWLSPTDVHCIVYPVVQQYLRGDITKITQPSLLEYLMSPV